MKVSISLVEGDRPRRMERSYAASEKEVFSLQERIADGVSRAGPIATFGGQEWGAKAGTHDVDALSKYGQAVEALERPDIPGNLQRAAAFLQSAIDRDPNFALAFARLGEAYLGDLSGQQRTELGVGGGNRRQQGADARSDSSRRSGYPSR